MQKVAIVVLAFAAAALFLEPGHVQTMFRMPHPYDSTVAQKIGSEYIARLPGNAEGPAIPSNLTGKWAVNKRLKRAKRLFQGKIHGCESVAISEDTGELLMLDQYGYLHRASQSGRSFTMKSDPPLYIGPGRPLGYHVHGGGLFVCDSLKGLLRVDLANGGIQILANALPSGTPLTYANDLDISADTSMLYFSSSTEGTVRLNGDGYYDTMQSYLLNLLRGDPSGRLLSYNLASGEVKVLLDKLFYANGVAVAPDGSFVAVVETNGHRVLRWHPDGKVDVLIDKLPGFPDGITQSADGNFLLTLVAPLSPVATFLAPYPLIRQLLAHVITYLSPLIAKRWGCVVKVSPSGVVLDVLMDVDGEVVSTVSAVVESNDGKQMLIGNLAGDYVSVLFDY